MADYAALFKGKKITQLGLGLLGRGVGDAEWLARAGAELLVTDIKTEEELKTSLDRLAAFPNITYHLGEHILDDFRDRDLILKGPGIPLDCPYTAEARKYNLPIDMSASLFARVAQIPLVGITGTRGKSTVTHLVYSILQRDYELGLNRSEGSVGRTGLPCKPVSGGNIRGVSNLALLDTVTPEHIGVFELDSWQCQGFAEERSLEMPGVRQGAFSPNIAVFTSFMPDHLNYYGGDMNAYLADKAHIFLHQDEDDVLVLSRQALPYLESYKNRMKAHVVIADESTVPNGWTTKLIGVHNRSNIGVAIETARALGVDDEVIREAVEVFEALPGRTQFVRECEGVKMYNDTNATTPEATIASLQALDPDGAKRVVLIVGGTDKGLDTGALLPAIEAYAKVAVLLKGTGTGKLQLHGHDIESYTVDTLEEALTVARKHAVEGDSILFSPAFASFGMFKNEYDRGEQFVALVNSTQ